VTNEHPGNDELGRRLEAYASVRLAPRRDAVARIRANVLEEARMRALEERLERPSVFGHGPRRRFVAILLAAALVMTAAVSVAAASSAGGPLYGARVWVEGALLPAESNARALERIHQIDERILEVERASQSGDSSAVAAAIAAYRAAVTAALDEVGSDGDRLAHLKAALGLHVVVLETLVDQAPPQALDGLTNAIDSSQKAVDKIDTTKPAIKPGGGPSATDGPGHTTVPAHTPAPRPTPDHTPTH
jgi:hypothetical protein